MKTMVIKINPEDIDFEKIKLAAEVIKKGGIVAFPTETVYGLGANAFDENACKKIFQAKGRPQDNPLIVHISSFKELEKVAEEVPKNAKPFMKKLWPGPFTAILRKRQTIPDVVSAGLPTAGIRMPDHPVARKLIELSGVPIAAPSANTSGKPSPTKAEHVIEDLMGKVDVIIDGGDTLYGIESTIIDFTKEPPLLLRPGPLYPEQLLKIGKVKITSISSGKVSLEKPLSPGMKYRHYAPEKPLILVEDSEKFEEVVKKFKKPIILCTDEEKENMEKLQAEIIVIGSLKSPFSIAKNLFHSLREADKISGDVIIIKAFEEKGILFSVMNRLRKAASEVIR